MRKFLLFATKSIRGFIYGIFSVSLILFLISRGDSPLIAGLIASGSIILSSLITFLITFKYHISRAKIFLISMTSMLSIGLLLLIPKSSILNNIGAIIGGLGVNPSDNTLFSSFEQPQLSYIAKDQENRNWLFSIYTLSGYAFASIGSAMLFLGIDYLIELSVLLSIVIMVMYSVMKFGTIENENKKQLKVSNETKKISRDVSLLFSLDAIGGGFVLQSLIAYWFKVRYGISLSSLGGIFAIVDVIIGASIVATPYIAKRLGLVKTMVYSHLPSNVFLILIPLIPNLWASLTFLFLRYSLSQMDVPTRQSYLNSIVPPEERSYVVGISNASRSIAQSTTPYISSSLISAAASPIPFIGGGTLKIIYDILLYLRFRELKEKY